MFVAVASGCQGGRASVLGQLWELAEAPPPFLMSRVLDVLLVERRVSSAVVTGLVIATIAVGAIVALLAL